MISASALLRNCGYPRALDRQRERTPEQQAALDVGTAFHGGVESWIKTGMFPAVENPELQGWLDLLASQWIPHPSAECEIAWGLSTKGIYLDVDEPEPHKYVARNGWPLLTAGRADLAFDHRGVLYVVDWKTGRYPVTPAARNLQVHAAGIALAQKYGAVSYCPAIYYVRDGVFDEGEEVPMGSPAAAAMFDEVKAAALLDDEPRPGDWCDGCWEKRKKTCKESA